jgi:hypothetical protein
LNQSAFDEFVYWIGERRSIYAKKQEGKPWPWTEDTILQTYKFTNVFRELDTTTVWMRENLTNPNLNEPHDKMIYNCALFRMFGTMEMCEAIGGWQQVHNPGHLKNIARSRLDNKERVFTGAYIITNQGRKDPKENIVVDEFVAGIWDNRDELASTCEQKSLERLHKKLRTLSGWGGGGFMAYELVSDLRHTNVLNDAKDILTWANAGPGAKRGLNRVFGRPLKFGKNRHGWNGEMRLLLSKVTEHFADPSFEMREIEHSLCEFDKYQRVKNNEGRPRSLYHPPGKRRSKWARYRARRKESLYEEQLRGSSDPLQSEDNNS